MTSPVRSVSGRRPSRPASAVSTAGCTSPCALCSARPSCLTSARRRTWSSRSWKGAHGIGGRAAWDRRHRARSATHGGGLSGRPSDLSFRCLSALVRVDFTMSSWVMFNSGCCWMYSRITSCERTNKGSVSASSALRKRPVALLVPHTASSAPKTWRSTSASSCQTVASTVCLDYL